MRQSSLRGFLPAAVLCLLAGCSSVLPGWETPGSTWFGRGPAPATTVVVVAAPPPTQADVCHAQAWTASTQLPQDRQLAYSQAWNACMQTAALGRPVVVETVPQPGAAPLRVPPARPAVGTAPRAYRN